MTRIEHVHLELRNAIRFAADRGLRLVRHHFEVRDADDRVVACCALGALDFSERAGRATYGLNMEAAEYDALEYGWDGHPCADADAEIWPREFWDLGADLAAEFKPAELTDEELAALVGGAP